MESLLLKKDEIAYAEVDMILSMMDKKYVNKIPKKLIKILKEEKRLIINVMLIRKNH